MPPVVDDVFGLFGFLFRFLGFLVVGYALSVLRGKGICWLTSVNRSGSQMGA